MFLKCAERQAPLAAIPQTQTRLRGKIESSAKARPIALPQEQDHARSPGSKRARNWLVQESSSNGPDHRHR